MRLLLAALLAIAAGRPFPDERLLLDRRLETLRRILPDGPRPASDVALVRELGDSARLAGLELTPRAPLETGTRGSIPVDVSAVGRYEEVDRFFRQVALSPRLIDVESLAILPGSDDSVRLAAVLVLPYRPLKAPLPAPPLGVRAQVEGVPRPQAEAFARDQALALDKSETIAELRRTRRNPRLFLSELAAIVRDRPVMLTRATLSEEFLVSGVTVGESAMRVIESRFERGFFRVSEVLAVRQGPCRRFEVRGRSPVVGIEAEIPLPTENPFRQEDASCQTDRDATRTQTLRAPAPKRGAAAPAAGITLRLRDVDLVDAFQALHLASGQGFALDEDVRGRVSLDVAGLELEQVIELLLKTGIRVQGPAAIRRVSRSAALPPALGAHATPAPEAARVSFSVKRTEVREILAALAEAQPDPPRFAPAAPLGRLSLFVREAAIEDVRVAVLAGARLVERVDGERRVVVRDGTVGEGDPLQPLNSLGSGHRLVLRPSELALEELDLAGLVRGPERWIALAYSPGGALFAYRAGERLADAVVTAVESTDVLFETEEGPIRLVLPDLTR